MAGKRVYIAGPYTRGDTAENVRKAVETAHYLLSLGHFPYVPHLTHFWHLLFPRPYEDWMRLDLGWLDTCDALIRLPGDSPGADREVAHAETKGIPVYYGLSEFLLKEDEPCS